jgi:hypothetical protein
MILIPRSKYLLDIYIPPNKLQNMHSQNQNIGQEISNINIQAFTFPKIQNEYFPNAKPTSAISYQTILR